MRRIEVDDEVTVTVELNGRDVTGKATPRMLLSDFLRHEIGFTGTHVGCEHGVCGCCTVRVDGVAGRSCLMLAVQADGRSITTIEGMAAADGTLHPVQQAFMEHHGLQCGYCTPGMVMAAASLLAEQPNPSEQDVRIGLEGNLCRCTGYHNIVRSVLAAAGGEQ